MIDDMDETMSQRNRDRENGKMPDDVIGEPLSRIRAKTVQNGWEFLLAAGSKWGFPAVMCLLLMGWVWFLTTSHQKGAAEAHKTFQSAMEKQTQALTKSIDAQTAEQRVTNQKLTEVDAALDAHLRRER